MPHSTVMGITAADCSSDVDVDAIMQFIDNANGAFETFCLTPAKPGIVRGAAFDYMLILRAAGSVASLARLLWMAYDKFIAPTKTPESDAGLYIGIRRPDGSVFDCRVGRDHANKDIFIEDFSAKVNRIHEADEDLEFYAKAEAEIRHTGIWIQRK